MDFLTEQSHAELTFYLNQRKAELGVCFNQAVPAELLKSSYVHTFYYCHNHLQSHYSSLQLIQGELTDLPLLTDSIDVIVIWHNLDFHEDAPLVIKECWRVLAPYGRILMVGGNSPCLFSSVKKSQYKQPINKRNKLVRLLLQEGFAIDVEKTFGFRPKSITKKIGHWLMPLEFIAQFCCPLLGSCYLIQAHKPVMGLHLPLAERVHQLFAKPKGLVQPVRKVQ